MQTANNICIKVLHTHRYTITASLHGCHFVNASLTMEVDKTSKIRMAPFYMCIWQLDVKEIVLFPVFLSKRLGDMHSLNLYTQYVDKFCMYSVLLTLNQEHQVNDALLKRRSAFEQLVGGMLHRKQLWFHGPITRDESEYRIRHYGVRDGLFLVRERTQVNSFALCVSFRSEVYHYLLDMNSLGQLSIENGRKFENLLQVVDHYSRTPDGLLCALNDVCPVTVFEDGGGPSRDQARVKHGPRRIERSEIEVFDTLGELRGVGCLLCYI